MNGSRGINKNTHNRGNNVTINIIPSIKCPRVFNFRDKIS